MGIKLNTGRKHFEVIEAMWCYGPFSFTPEGHIFS